MKYNIGDTINYHREGYIEAALAVVWKVFPHACFAEICLPQYSTPILVMIRNDDIIEVMEVN